MPKIMTYLNLHYRKARKIVFSTIFSFIQDDCYTKSSTLTFYTIQAIVPFLAFFLGIAKGFGFDEYLQGLIIQAFSVQKEVADYSITIANTMLKHIREGVIIGVGVLLLIWAMINLLGYIELVLNQIWKIKEQRSLFRKINDYVAIIIICPLIFIVSSSFTLFLKTRIALLHGYPVIEEIGVFLLLGFKFASWFLSWLLFFLLYFLMPNDKLRIWPIIFASVLAGSAFQIWQIIYINFQIQIFNYNVVYGSFSILPLLLIWLQISWVIALAGAELAANIENVLYYEEDHKFAFQGKISRKQLGLMILYYCLEPFYLGKSPLTDIQITKILKIPLNITKTILKILLQGEILAAVELKEGGIGYHPFSDPSNLPVKEVCDIIEKDNDIEITMEKSEILEEVTEVLHKLDQAEEESSGNQSLRELYLKLLTKVKEN